MLSLLLWLHVQSQASQLEEFSFSLSDVRTQNVPEGLVLTEEKATVDVEIVGPPDLIDTFKKQNRHKNLKAFVDVGSAQVGTQDFRVNLEPRSDLAGLQFKQRAPTVSLTFEERSDSEFPVEVVTAGEPPAGFEFGTAAIDPPNVRLVGAKSKMLQVGSVRAALSLSSTRPGGTYPVTVEVLDRRGNPMTSQFRVVPTSVDVTPALSPAQPRRTLLVSPRFSGQPAAGFQVTQITVRPLELMVQGDRSRISGLSILETMPIKLDGLNKTRTFEIDVFLPTGVKLDGKTRPNNTTVRVTVQVAPIQEPAPPATPPPGP